MRTALVVIGGGHAGCEAAAAASKMGIETVLLTTEPAKIGKMSCNPAIGGVGKGQLVREIDALGGLMGRMADKAAIQYKVLNRRKGPAVWGFRAQEDRKLYALAVRRALDEIPKLEIIKGTATGIVVRGGRIEGVVVDETREIGCEALVVASGTFLGGRIHTGEEISPGGRMGEAPAEGMTGQLVAAGLKTSRFKTGTPPRVDGRTVDYTMMREEWGDAVPIPFSNFGSPSGLPRRPCWLTGTTEETHRLIRRNIDRAPLYTGQIQAVGPRSCPSVEDKVMRFPGRVSHPVFVEPEGLDTTELYLNGLSTSLPREIQQEIVSSVPGLKNAEITRYGYAIEYDYFPPQQLLATLETKTVNGLYLAGQINGTTGYEEAGALGLMAGINAALAIMGREPIVITRKQAYIGVMIDDLVLKGVDYPYRIYTSRAEARLCLRNDNADLRLSGIGRKVGLLDDDDYDRAREKSKQIDKIRGWLRDTQWSREKLEAIFTDRGERFSRQEYLEAVLRRPSVTIGDFVENGMRTALGSVCDEAIREAELAVKYEGYIKRAEIELDRTKHMDELRIPEELDYATLQNMTTVSREKLQMIRPVTVGQASRVPGVTSNDIAVLSIAVEKIRRGAA